MLVDYCVLLDLYKYSNLNVKRAWYRFYLLQEEGGGGGGGGGGGNVSTMNLEREQLDWENTQNVYYTNWKNCWPRYLSFIYFQCQAADFPSLLNTNKEENRTKKNLRSICGITSESSKSCCDSNKGEEHLHSVHF